MARLAKRALSMIMWRLTDPSASVTRRTWAAQNPCQPALVHRRRSLRRHVKRQTPVTPIPAFAINRQARYSLRTAFILSNATVGCA